MLLEAKRIEKRYGGVRALKHVSFGLRAGEVHALVGENGAGKSTLIKVLTGAVQADAGVVEMDGAPIGHNSPRRSRELGIAAIYQQPAIFPDLTVAENIALANEGGGLARRVGWHARAVRAKELLDQIGADIDPQRDAGTLSMPEQQLVEIAKALGANVRVLILDEPTASLTELETERLFAIIARLRGQGTGVIYISHRLEELGRIADRITVLRDGETIETRAAADTDIQTLIRLMAGRELSEAFPNRNIAMGEVVLDVAGLKVRSGEIVGLAGLVGAGRTELAETIFGLRPGRGPIRSPEDAISAGIAYVPEDRRRNGVVSDLPVRSNISLAVLNRISSRGLIQESAERALADEWAVRLGVKSDGIDAVARSLSGGNQQKVSIARWLATKPRVLILDEPTQGIDVAAKAECHRIMRELAAQGMAILMISSELNEIMAMSDRIVVMRGGAIVGEMTRADASPEAVLAMALGHK